MNMDEIKKRNTEQNKATRKLLHELVGVRGRCAYINCNECTLCIKHPRQPEISICLLTDL